MSFDYAIHSDLLVCWTGGKDIDRDVPWDEEPSSKTDDVQVAKYIERLTNILKHGLWMTSQPPPNIGRDYGLKEAPCACFTELKLSQSRSHARLYGRLGVGFKRPFLFARGGRPVVYYGTKAWASKDRFLHACASAFHDKHLMHFFQPMNSSLRLNYDLYSESEWRIVFDEERIKDGIIVDPRDPKSPAFRYFQSLQTAQQNKLRYLIPVDGWLSLIIYPSLAVKNAAQAAGSEIGRLLKDLKANTRDHANMVEGGNYPVEIDLDLCRNF